MYRLIAIDLDGTLLDSYGEVSKKNKEQIQRVVKNGIEVVLSSGRPIMSVKNLANELGANHYMICGNGAITYDLQKDEIIYNRFLEKEKVLQIIKICEENSIYYNVYTEDMILTKVFQYNVLFYQHENANKSDDKKTQINVVPNIYEYVRKSENQNYLKVTICDNDKMIFDSIMRKLKNIKKVEILEVAHMSRIKDGTQNVLLQYYYTEITNKNVDKWYALQDLVARLGIQENEIMAIGDNVNDKKMIENAGLGIAMGESAPYIKEVADEVTLDNDHDGVGVVIEKYV